MERLIADWQPRANVLLHGILVRGEASRSMAPTPQKSTAGQRSGGVS